MLAYPVGAALAVMVALCLAELGALYPVAGGMYSIVARVLGTWAAFLTLLSYVVQAVFLPASIALGVGTYLHSLNSSFPVSLSSAVAMVVVTGLALLRIHVNALMTALFLAPEVVVIVVIAAAGFSHPTQGVTDFVHPVGLVEGTLRSFGTGAVIAAVAIALQSVNGYDAAISFAEETKGSTRNVGKAVLVSCLVAIGLELAAFLGAAVGAPDLKAFLGSSTPLTYVVERRFGHTASTLLTVGAVIAFFNACLAITLQFSRVLWASGRDRIWPGPVSTGLQRLLPSTDAPWVATLAVGTCATVLCFLSDVVAVVTFVSVLTLAIYVFVGVTLIVSRQRDRGASRPFRLPLYPLPPVVAILDAVLALSSRPAWTCSPWSFSTPWVWRTTSATCAAGPTRCRRCAARSSSSRTNGDRMDPVLARLLEDRAVVVPREDEEPLEQHWRRLRTLRERVNEALLADTEIAVTFRAGGGDRGR